MNSSSGWRVKMPSREDMVAADVGDDVLRVGWYLSTVDVREMF